MRSGGLWGIKGDQVKRLKELEAESTRLRWAVSDLTLDKMILPEAARGNHQAPRVAGPALIMFFSRTRDLRATGIPSESMRTP
jgi:hypothetical protein